MRRMYFANILIADIERKTAYFHEFEKGINIITSKENHVGKSSLLKSLYYTMGADVDFDDLWNKSTKLCVVEFYVDRDKFKIVRWKKAFALFDKENLILTTNRISGDLAKKLEEIFSFSVYILNKKTKKIELAPPTFTFMPYYIDQDKGWNKLYESFNNINQYKKTDRIKSLYYHLGIYTKFTVKLTFEKDILNDKIEKLKIDKENMEKIQDYLYSEVENIVFVDSIEELEKNLEVPKMKIISLVSKIGEMRNKIQNLEIALFRHEKQLQVIKEHKKLKSDTNELKHSKSLYECPKCGYNFNEEIYDIVRLNYNIQNENYIYKQIEQIIDEIKANLKICKEDYIILMSELSKHDKLYNEKQDLYKLYLKQVGLQESIKDFTDKIGKNLIEQNKYKNDIKRINNELKKLNNKEEIERIYSYNVRMNIIKLDAWNSVYGNNINILKEIKAQGTLENKIILAQVIGLFQTMRYFNTDVTLFPIIIDSPRAKEASYTSSKDILNLIFELDYLPQIILATMDYNDFKIEIKREVKITEFIEKRKLLNEKVYDEYKDIIEEFKELLVSTTKLVN